MKIYMFPGQGSQFKGMGADLFDRYKDLTAQADGILGYSLKELCLEDLRGELNKTQFTQPALYVVNALSYFKKIEETGKTPDFVIGHSLGEFNALMAAGGFDFETGLKLVQKRGELMGQVSNGAMAAVLNASKAQIEEALKSNGLNNVYLANYNTPSQIVLSGLVDEIAKAEPLFKQGKMRYYPLATSGAFHSAYMRDAMESFKTFLQGFQFSELKIPVLANATARPYQNESILETLASQIAHTVRWSESVQYLLALQARQGITAEFEELGPGDVLTKLVFTIKAQTPEAVVQQFIQSEWPAAAQADLPKVNVGVTQPVNTSVKTESPRLPVGLTDEKVQAWNQRYPVGTRVKSTLASDTSLETRTPAVVLFGHRAAVYVKGYNGYFDLDELTPA